MSLTKTAFQNVVGVLLLSALALAGTYFNLSLYNSISFIFGSVFALVAMRVFGLVPGLIVCAAGASYTVLSWNHPYALLTFLMELTAVYFISKRVDNIAVADALFWLVLGCPLVLLFYSGVMGMESTAAGFIAIKQAVNGVFNAVVAGFILLALARWIPTWSGRPHQSAFQSMVFYVLMLVSTFAAAGLTVLESRREFNRALDQLATVQRAIADWVQDEVERGTTTDEIATGFRERIEPFLLQMTDVMPVELDLGVAVVPVNGEASPIVGSVRSIGQGGSLDALENGVLLWSPDGDLPAMVRSRESRYVHWVSVNADGGAPADIVVELSAGPLVAYLESGGRRDMMLLAMALSLSMLVAKALSEWLGAPIRRLASISDNLSSAIMAGGSMSARFPRSSIEEYQTLSTSMRQMSEKLSESFQSLRAIQKTLEDRVRERTRELDRMSQVARQASNSVIITDAEGRIEWINDAFTKMTGYALQELKGRAPGEVLHGEDTDPAVIRTMREALSRIEPFEVEVKNYTKSGEPYWVSISCSPIWESGGRHAGFLAIETDVTERLETSRMLQASLERIRLATEIAQIGIWVYDPQTGEVDWDEQNHRLYRVGLDRFDSDIGNWYNYIHPDDRPRVAREVEVALSVGGAPFSSEFRVLTPDGGERIFVSVASVLRDEQGKAIRMTGVNRDVTDDRHVEEALRYVAKRNAAVLDNVVDSIITLDQHGTIQTFNRASERIFGYAAEDVIGRSISLLMPSNPIKPEARFLGCDEEGQEQMSIGVVREMEALRRNGEVFPMELAVSELESRGEKMYIGIIRDITERRRVERMQSEFIATVSHELRTPMTSIAGALALIRGGVFGKLEEKAEGVLDAAIHNCERLSSLINEILDLERLNAGKLVLEIERCELGWLINHCIEVNRSFGDKYGVGLAIEGEIPDTDISVDRNRAVQVLTNYLSNAVKFSEAGQNVRIRALTRGRMVRIEVEDDGCGIPEEYHDAIFEKFSQTDASDTRKSGGSGLGLAITKELAVQMNGQVGFFSSAGQGATFWVEFPVHDSDEDETTYAMRA